MPPVKEDPLVLYLNPGSAPCRAVWMTCRALGIKVNVKMINLFTKQQLNSEFLRINPSCSVPCIDDNGFILWESRAIMTYLVDKYDKGNALYPTDIKQRALVTKLLFFDIVPLYYNISQLIYPQLYDDVEVDDKQLQQVETALDCLEEHLKMTNYATGSIITLADISLLSSVTALELINYKFEPYPRVEKWLNNLKENLTYYPECNKGLENLKEMLSTKKYYYRNIVNG